MKVKVLKECGYEESLRGMAYSFKDRAKDPDEWWQKAKERAEARAPLLVDKDAGHNKFIRQIDLWLDIEACRAWWSEFDTYKVGTVTQSESTMHTLQKRPPTKDDFEPLTSDKVVNSFIEECPKLKDSVTKLKLALPEGYLQRRIVKLSYANLRDIFRQRRGHRFEYWDIFLDSLKDQVEHWEFLSDLEK